MIYSQNLKRLIYLRLTKQRFVLESYLAIIEVLTGVYNN
jgi:hypothetical protein